MSKKGENIYKRKDGRWEGRYIKERCGNKLRYGYVYGQSYKEAKEKLINERAKKSEQGASVKLYEIAEMWLESVKPILKESSVVKYASILNSYIYPEIGNKYINKITDTVISDFALHLLESGGKKKNGLSPKTVSDVLSLMKTIRRFATARNIEVIYTASFPLKQRPKCLRVFSVQEQKRLCSHLLNENTPISLGILLCLFTGIRIGELCALKWDDISLNECTVKIQKTMQRLHVDGEKVKTKIRITSPKSECSVRTVPIPEALMRKIIIFKKSDDAYFLTGNSNYIEPRTMQNQFKRFLRDCGIGDANFHALRHTFATRCVEAGFDIKTLSEILGHSNVNITLDRYVHPTLDLKRENMNKLSFLLAVK